MLVYYLPFIPKNFSLKHDTCQFSIKTREIPHYDIFIDIFVDILNEIFIDIFVDILNEIFIDIFINVFINILSDILIDIFINIIIQIFVDFNFLSILVPPSLRLQEIHPIFHESQGGIHFRFGVL